MATLLYRLGRFAARRAWLVISAWVLIIAMVGGAAALFMGTLSNNFTIPGTETQRMADKLQEDLPDFAGGSGSVVFVSTDGKALTTEQQQAISKALGTLTTVPTVKGSTDPFDIAKQQADGKKKLDDGKAEIAANEKTLADAKKQLDAGQAQISAGKPQLEAAQKQLDAQKAQFGPNPQLDAAQAQLDAKIAEAAAGEAKLAASKKQYEEGLAKLTSGKAEIQTGERTYNATKDIRMVSDNGKAAIAQIQFTESMQGVSPENRQLVQDRLNTLESAGVTPYYSKDIVEDVSELFGIAEALGIAVAAAVLIIMLGTLWAAGLPLLMALVGVAVGVGGTMALTSVIDMSSISPMLALMIGLAVGIDYCLFIVNRHRQQLGRGMELKESIAKATGTSGNAVMFAGLTVVIALAALSVTGLPFLIVMGLSAAATVAIAVVVALTLTPAVLSLLGRKVISKRGWAKIDANIKAHADAASAGSDDELTESEHKADLDHANRGWGALVTKRPIITLIAAVAVLGVMAIPAAGLRLALPDGGSEPIDSSAYKSYSITADNFGAGQNGPIIVVGSLPAGLDASAATKLNLDVADQIRKVANVKAVVPAASSKDLRTTMFQVIPSDGPASESTVQVVHDIRGEAAAISDKYKVEIGLTGQTAGNVDVSAKLAEALPPYLAIVVGLSLVLLILVFRSILVPLLATAGFLLSLVAAFGGVVAVYQWGWLGAIFDVANPSAVLSFLPIIVIGVLFGLAMDYQVFIASGMREAYAHGQSAKQAVRTGFSHAAPVVTAAAIIMISVFAGFIFSHLTMVRPMGFALALGVLLDAFVVRMTIVPAAMHLMGKSAWWLPKWLDRIMPDVDVEGAKLEEVHNSANDSKVAEKELVAANS